MAQTFSVTVLAYEDGTLAVTDSEITGLIIEVGTFDKLLVELPRVASDLLRLNHGLADEQIANATLHVEFKRTTDAVLQQKSSSSNSLPRMSWSSNERSHPVQYA